jgi:hypothetical protein
LPLDPRSPTAAPLSAFEHHLLAPRGRGRLSEAPHAGAAGGAVCGDLIRVATRVEGDRVAEAGFEAAGCAAARAAGSEHRRANNHREQLERLRGLVRAPVSTLPFIFEPELGPDGLRALAAEV